MTVLFCKKCGTAITKQVRQISKKYQNLQKGSYQDFRGKVPKYWGDNFRVHPASVLDQNQLKFKSGWGCCGNSSVDFKCFACDTPIGTQQLDCWESKSVWLDYNKVQPNHKWSY